MHVLDCTLSESKFIPQSAGLPDPSPDPSFPCPCGVSGCQQDGWVLDGAHHPADCKCDTCRDISAMCGAAERVVEQWRFDREDWELVQDAAAFWEPTLRDAHEEWMAALMTDADTHSLGWTAYTWEPSTCNITVAGKTSEGLREALEWLGVDVRYNTRAARSEAHHKSFGWAPMNDRLTAKLRELLAERFNYTRRDTSNAPLRFGGAAWNESLGAMLYDRETDPFLEWLEFLPAWDGTARVDQWLHRAFVIVDRNELAEWASRHILLGAVARAYQPGLKLDETVVLIGPGGIGKSTCLRFLLPPDAEEWFSDGLNLAADPKERAECLQGRVIIEAAELTGVTRADIESLKGFLSRTNDGSVRLAYRRNPELLLRRAIIVGTADRDRPLPNTKNLRRFVPVNLVDGNPAIIRLMLDKDREQLWAEALHLHHRGAEARLPEDLVDEQSNANANARSRDTIIEDEAEAWLTVHPEGFTMGELACGIGLVDSSGKVSRVSMRDQHRLGSILERLGYVAERRMIDGSRAVRWFAGTE